MEIKCWSCSNHWEPTRVDPYILRCGFCGALACERCGRHDLARIHVCPSCYTRKGNDLEDIFVGACESCGWVRPTGVVGYGTTDARRFCQMCLEKGRPEQKPENAAAFTRESFQRRVHNYFSPLDTTDPGNDLLPLTAKKFQEWDSSFAFDSRDRGISQAAFHRDAASVDGLLGLFAMDRYKLKNVARALGRINCPEGDAFLLAQVNTLNDEPYNAGLALQGLCETPGETALTAVIWTIDQAHFSINLEFCLELLLSMEFMQPGFLFQPKVARTIQECFDSINMPHVPQHLAYFWNALTVIE